MSARKFQIVLIRRYCCSFVNDRRLAVIVVEAKAVLFSEIFRYTINIEHIIGNTTCMI